MYSLTNSDTANVVGIYPTELAALRDVASTALRYGAKSLAASSLVLTRDDVPAEQGFIAEGVDLVLRALAAVLNGQPPVYVSATANHVTPTQGAMRLNQVDEHGDSVITEPPFRGLRPPAPTLRGLSSGSQVIGRAA